MAYYWCLRVFQKDLHCRARTSPAMTLPSLTSPPAIINHVTRGMKSSGTTSISEHCYIYMTIQRDLPASRCHIHCICLCVFLLSDADFAGCIQVHIVVVVQSQTTIDHCFIGIVYLMSSRRLPSTTSCSDRSRPGSCVRVCMCRAGPGNQWSQRLVCFPVSHQCQLNWTEKEIILTSCWLADYIGRHM